MMLKKVLVPLALSLQGFSTGFRSYQHCIDRMEQHGSPIFIADLNNKVNTNLCLKPLLTWSGVSTLVLVELLHVPLGHHGQVPVLTKASRNKDNGTQ